MRLPLFIVASVIFWGLLIQVQPAFRISKDSFISQFDATEREVKIINTVYDNQTKMTQIAKLGGFSVYGIFAFSLLFDRKKKKKSNQEMKADEK